MKVSSFTKILAFTTLTLAALLSAPYVSAATGSGDAIIIGISGTQMSESPDGPNVGTTDTTTTMFDAKIGYTMANGLYVGGIYGSRTDESGSSKVERSSYGGTIGYHNSGWFLDGSYFLSASQKYSSGTELKDGSGFGVDLGHNFDLTSNIYLGLQISYKSYTFNKVNEVSTTNKIKSELSPMLNLGVSF